MYVSHQTSPLIFSLVEQEIKTNRERCQEVIDKVLRKSRMLYEHLLVIAQSPNRDRLNRFESTLTDYGRSVLNKEYQVYRFVDPQFRILDEVYKILQANSLSKSKSIMRTITNRATDDIDRCERLVDNIHNDVLLVRAAALSFLKKSYSYKKKQDIVMEIRTEQVTPSNRSERYPSSILTSPVPSAMYVLLHFMG